MGALGVGTATLDALFGEGIDGILQGELLCECSMDKAYVDIPLGIADDKDFDIADPSLAAIFQLDTQSSDELVDGVYRYVNSVTYQTLIQTYNDSTVPVFSIYYNTTPNTSFTFNITMP